MGGRIAAMPAWGEVLGESGVKNVAAYVRHDLAGLPLPQDATLDLAAGKQAFDTTCVACHGANGKGMPMMGAPDLTQPAGFIYGTSLAQLQQTIRHGRQGHMPAQNELLATTRYSCWRHTCSACHMVIKRKKQPNNYQTFPAASFWCGSSRLKARPSVAPLFSPPLLSRHSGLSSCLACSGFSRRYVK